MLTREERAAVLAALHDDIRSGASTASDYEWLREMRFAQADWKKTRQARPSVLAQIKAWWGSPALPSKALKAT
jgi:hypothetical protein